MITLLQFFRTRRSRLLAGLAFVLLFVIIVQAPTASAAIFVVDSTSDAVDANPGDGVCATSGGACTLRAAIQEANALSGTDTINVPAGTYTLAIATGAEDSAFGDFDITGPLSIIGAGAGTTIIDGGLPPVGSSQNALAVDRLFEIHPTAGNVSLSYLTIQGGWSAENGGGIYNVSPGTVRLESVSVSDNFSEAEGGGIFHDVGRLIVTGTAADPSLISNNTARGGGGIYNAGLMSPSGITTRLEVSFTTISGNSAQELGGGIEVVEEGLLTITNSSFVDNTTTGSGGGLSASSQSTLTVTDTSFDANSALGDGGGLYTATEGQATITNVTFTGNSVGEEEEAAGGGLYVGGSGSADISASTFTANSATGEGGGIAITNGGSVSISDSTISENSAGASGGGVMNGGSTVTFTRLTITNNTTDGDGGGIESQSTGNFTITESNINSNTAENGGGFANAGDGTLHISRSTFWDNRALVGASEDSGLGGGIYSLGDAAAEYTNVTISANLAQTRAGGLYTDADAGIRVVNTTIAFNSAPIGSGVADEGTNLNTPVPSTSVIFRNTIVAGNIGGSQCNFALGSEGGNLENGDSCMFRGPGDRPNASDPGLDAVADNGGSTLTMALHPDSLAVDNGVLPCPSTDQRGVSRPQNTSCDSGAFEFEGPFPPPDTEAPDTEFLTGPVQDSEATSIFTFTGIDDVTAIEDLLFECRLLEFDPAEPPEPPDPTQPPDPAFAFLSCPSPWQVPIIEDGTFQFEVRAIDRAGNVDPTPAVHQFTVELDLIPPDTFLIETPSDPSGSTATFTFGATDNATPAQFLEFECRLDSNDPAAWLECSNPTVYANLTPGTHTFQVRAADGGDNIDPSPATFTWTVGVPEDCNAANITLFAAEDSYVDQALPLDTHGFLEGLTVRSAAPGNNARALLRFELPPELSTTYLADCDLESATLRIYGDGDSGRILEAYTVDASWTENTVNWINQPDTTGTPATASSGAGYRSWNLTAQVAAMIAGDPNYGFLIRDSVEEDATGVEQAFLSSEAVREPPVPPQLVLRFADEGTPPPPPPDEPVGTTAVTCGQVIMESITLQNDLLGCLAEGLVVGASNIVIDLNSHTISSGLPIEPGEEDGLVAGIRNAGYDNVVVRNGTVRNFGYGVRLLPGTTFNVIENLTLFGNINAGIELYDADNGRDGNIVRNNEFFENGAGVQIVFGSENSVVEDNYFFGNAGVAVYMYDSSGHVIENNTVSGLTTNPLLDSDGGFYLEASSDNIIRYNELSDTGDSGILLTAGSNNNLLQFNSATRASDSAISLDDSDGNQVLDNIVHLAGGAGIGLGNANDNVIRGNDVRFNPGGIELAGSSSNLIEDNNASEVNAAGISVEGGVDNIILNNLVNNTGAEGISVEAETLDALGNPIGGFIIDGNQANNNLASGISVGGSGHTIRNNEAYNNLAYGIFAAVGNIDGGSNLASGNAEPAQCVGVVCSPGTGAPPSTADLTPPDTELLTFPANGSSTADPAVFTFTGSDNNAPALALHFECRLDAPPDPPPPEPEPGEPPEPPDVDNWVECASPQSYSFLLAGDHKFEVRAIDPADNVDLTPVVYTWTVVAAPPGADSTPPSTTITDGPDDPTTSTTATFSFTGSDNSTPGPNLSFECSLDGGAFSVCTSPVTYTGLSLGVHDFAVQAVDLLGNIDPTPATYSWTIEPAPADTTPPDTIINSGPELVTVSTEAIFSFSFTGDEDEDEDDITYECSLDGEPFAACSSPQEYTGLSVGIHTFEVRAIDDDDNEDPAPAAYTWEITPAVVPTVVSCGQTVTQSILLLNSLENCLADGLIVGTDKITIDLNGNTIDGTSVAETAGIRIDGFDDVTVVNGTITEFGYGMLLNPGSARNLISDLTIQLNPTAGVALSGALDSTVRDNIFAGNGDAIQVINGAQGNLVQNNDIGGSGGLGLAIVNASHNRLENNTIAGSGDQGIEMLGATFNELVGNSISGSSDTAFAVEEGSNDNYIADNHVFGSEAGMNVAGSHRNQLINNRVTGSSDNGISLEAANDNFLYGNDLRFNTGGVQVSGSLRNRIEANILSDITGNGLELGDGALENVIIGNFANNNDADGISVEGSAPPGEGNLIEGNFTSGNASDGIAVNGAGHIILGNEATGNSGWGIYASGPSTEGFNIDGGYNIGQGNAEPEQCYNIRCDGGPPPPIDTTPPETVLESAPADPSYFTSATFSFSGSDNASGVVFECRLTPIETDFASCTNPASYSGLALGSYTFEVRAIDFLGNIDPTSASYTWTVEVPPPGVAPETFIDSGPDVTTSSTSATFTFSSNEELVTFECALDGGSFAVCTNPVTFNGLATGARTLEVRAVDNEAFPDLTPATYSWTITAAPVAQNLSCGQIVTQSVILNNNLTDCPGSGLIIGANNITLDLNGRTIDGTNLGVGILNNGFDNVVITNGFIQEFDVAVQLNAGTSLNVVSGLNTLANQDGGILLSNADQNGLGNTIRNNTIGESNYGIALLDGTTGTLVHDNDVSATSDSGIYLLSSNGNQIENNTVFEASGAGVALEGSSNNTVIGNELTSPSDAGVLVGLETFPSNNNRIEDNVIRLSGAAGIAVTGSSGNELINNDIRESSDGISLELAQGNLLFRNDIRSNSGGISLNGSNSNQIESNTVSANSGGISLEGLSLGNVIVRNTVTNNSGDGIYIADPAPAGQGNVIEFNTVSSNSSGIFVNAAAHTITGNIADLNDGWGIYAVAGNIDGGGNAASGNAEPEQCFTIVCTIGTPPGAPDTIIVEHPSDPTNNRDVYFTFTGTDNTTLPANMGFQCRLDSTNELDFLDCENPQFYTALEPGTHTFEVRAIDENEFVDPTPASYTWTYIALPSGVAPDTFIDSGPPLESTLLEGIFLFSSNEPGVTYECSLDGAPFTPCGFEGTEVPVDTGIFEFAFEEFEVGSHNFRVRATDFEGNTDPTPASYDWVIGGLLTTVTDGPAYIPPAEPGEPAIGGETTDTTATLVFEANVADSTFFCSLDFGPYEPCVSPVTYTDLPVGEHVFLVYAVDPEGAEQAEPTEYGWAVIPPLDTTPPVAQLLTTPADNSSEVVFTFTGTDNLTVPAGLLFECSLDGVAFEACTSPLNLYIVFPDFVPGANTFYLQAVDAEDNISAPVSYSWTAVADTTAPEVLFLTTPLTETIALDALFTFSASDNTTPVELLVTECSLDGAPFEVCESPYEISVEPGLHELQVQAIDLSANVSTAASFSWEVIGPPVTTFVSGPAAVATDTTATFEFVADQLGATFACALDGAAFEPCSSPVEYTGLANGDHALEVQATNTFGLVEETPALYAWTVDAPVDTTILSGPVALTASPDATFTFTANIDGSTFECSLDGSAFASCTSPAEYTGLAPGAHTFAVQATDPLGSVDPTPATFAWTIDTSVHSLTVSCGEVLAVNALILNDLTDCPADGLIIGASGLTIDLNGRTIDGSGLVGVGTGILNNGFDSVTITNGTVQEFSAGIALLTGTQNNVVSDVTLIGNLSVGVHLVDASGNEVVGNIVDGLLPSGLPGSDSGILLEGSSDNELLGNTVSATGDAGIVLSANSGDNLIEGNIMSNTGDAGVSVQDSDGNNLISNSAQGVSDSGIGLDNAHNSIIRLNHLSFNAGGIELLDSTGNLVEDNIVSDNGGHGILVEGEAAAGLGNTLDSNIAERNGQDGINVAAAVHTIVSNTANDNQGWGIFAAPGNTDGGGNTASGNGQAGQCTGVVCSAGPATTVDTTIDSGPAATTADTSATFTFTANEPVTQFECSLDGAAFTTCASPVTLTGLAQGGHTFLVRAVDLASNPDPTPASYIWTVLDTTPPETTLDTGTPASTVSTEATFAFSANETGSTFECSLDLAPFESCESPLVLTDLELGTHSFEVRAIDLAGNIDPTPAGYTWTVEPDTTSPDTTITAGPSGLNGSTIVVFEFTGSDDATAALDLAFECALDGAPFESCDSPHEIQDLTLGDHTFEVRAIDEALNVDATPASQTWMTVDVIAPETAIDTGPADPTESTTATFTFSADEPGATFECALDGADFTACTSPHEETGLAVGLHTLQVRAVDLAGNADTTPESYQWTVVSVDPPDTTINNGPADPSPSPEALFSFGSDQPNVTFECSLDGEPFAECESPYELQDLTDGSYELQVRAVDLIGKVDPTPASYTWIVDLPNTPQGSDVTVVVTTADNSTAASLTFEEVVAAGDTTLTVDTAPPALPDGYLELGSLFYDVDTTAVFTGNINVCLDYNPADFAAPEDLQLLHHDGTSWVDVTTSNDTVNGVLCGDVTSLSPFSLALPEETAPPDTMPPDTTIDSGPDMTTTATSATFTFSSNESGSTFACSLDGASFAACTSPHQITDLAAGAHTFEVQAIDAAGNADPMPAGYAWTVEGVTADCGTQLILSADADAWIDQGSATSNKGDDSILKVMSKGPSSNLRGLVRFAMPTSIPDGCVVESATLRLYAASWASGRTLQALQVAGAWTENSVTWNNQPATAGAAATTTSGQGYREWNVAAQVQAMYDAGANHGFLIRDATENQDAEQQFHSREKGESMPQLVITFAPAPPPADSTPPLTTINSGPEATTTETSATFTFSANEAGATFECSLDAAPFAACASPAAYTGLALGDHEFQVHATDAAGNVDATPASYTWSVEAPPDTTAPETTINTGPEATTTETSATFTFSSDEADSTFACSLDGAPFTGCTSPADYSGLAVGNHTFAVQATDAVGNTDATPTSYTWTVEAPADTTPPDTAIDLEPVNPTTETNATFAFSANEFGATFECLLDGTEYAVCTSPVTYTDLSLGEHTFAVRAIDGAGNIDPTPASYTWTIEAPPTPTPEPTATATATPEPTATSSPTPMPTLAPTATATATPEPTATSSPTPEPTATTEPTAEPTATSSPTPTAMPSCTATTVTYEVSADAWIEQNSPSNNKGDDSILKVKAQGSSDNFRALVNFPLPAAAPEGCVVESATLRLYSDSWTSGRTIEALQLAAGWTENGVTWSNQPATTGTAATTASGQGYREWSVASQVQAMFDTGAIHGFLIRDAVEGGSGAEQQFFSREKGENPPQLVISFVAAGDLPPDETAPQTTLDTWPSSTTTSTSASFTFSADEADSTFACSLDEAAFGACTSPAEYTGLSEGVHTFEVQAIDAAGNVEATPASYTWTVEAPPAAVDCGAPVTLFADADAWIDQGSASSNKGDDSVLKVQAKSNNNVRALVRFAQPAVPAGCVVQSATLRLYASSWKNNRTLQALQLAGAWTENGVTWSNQPATTGTAATTNSGSGWREWNVTIQVQAMVDTGVNHGFLIRDASSSGKGFEQQFHAREKGENVPMLILSFGSAGG